MSEPVPPLSALRTDAQVSPLASASLHMPDAPPAQPGGDAAAPNPHVRARADATATAFEAAMLTSFIEPMLPSEDSPVWGGTGASAWRGLFAQEVAAELARAGGIGLADTVRPSLIEQSAAPTSDPTNDRSTQ